MKYSDLRDFIAQLEQRGELKRVAAEVDPYLEVTEICDRTLRAGGPEAIFCPGKRLYDLPGFRTLPDLLSVEYASSPVASAASCF